MLAKFRSHLAHNVVGYIALFIALGGTSYAVATGSIDSREIKNNSIKSKDIKTGAVKGSDVKNNGLTGKDVNEGSLGAVPNAGRAFNAQNAVNAINSNQLGGLAASAYARSAQPGFTNATLAAGFTNLQPSTDRIAAYMKDTLGFVHLRGAMNCPAGTNTAFTLPAGFRPDKFESGPLYVFQQAGGLFVSPNGEVQTYLPGAGTVCAIGGFSFKADR